MDITIQNDSGRTAYIQFVGNDLQITPTGVQEVANKGTVSFTLTKISAGRIYVSYDKALSTTAPDGANPTDADYKTRFDKVELTYTEGDGGKANLTTVDFYAIPFEMQTFLTDSTGTKIPIEQFTLKSGTTGANLQSEILKITTDSAAATVSNGTETVRVLSPVKAPSAYTDLQPYANKVVSDKISMTISGTFYGTPSKDYSYTSSIVTAGSETYIQLDMTNEKTISIPTSSLGAAIYTCDGAYYLNKDYTTVHKVSENDFYAAVYRDVVAAMNLGYVDGKDGNDSSSWWGNAPYSAANSTYYNQYAAEAYDWYPGAYGFPFSDRQKQVLMDLGGSISEFKVTILGDNQKPTILDLPGVLNPQTGIVKFNIIPVFATGIQDKEILVGGNMCKAGWINDYLTGPTQNMNNPKSAQINNCVAQEGWNKYEFLIGTQKYLVIVEVVNGVITQGAISGGGNSTWTSPNLFLGGLETFGKL